MNSHLKCIRFEDLLHLAKQADWCVGELARICKVSPRTLERHFLKEMHCKPKKWLIKCRNEEAKRLLSLDNSVKETAAQLGYRHSRYFSTEFKKQCGLKPTCFVLSQTI